MLAFLLKTDEWLTPPPKTAPPKKKPAPESAALAGPSKNKVQKTGEDKVQNRAGDQMRLSFTAQNVKIPLENGEPLALDLPAIHLDFDIRKKIERVRSNPALSATPSKTSFSEMDSTPLPGANPKTIPGGAGFAANFRMDDNLADFVQSANADISQFLHQGDYNAALEYIMQAKYALSNAQLDASDRLKSMGLDNVAEQLNLRFEDARKPLDVWQSFCTLVLSTYHPETPGTARPDLDFESLDAGALTDLIGPAAYERMRTFFVSYGRVTSAAAPGYSKLAGTAMKQGFTAAEEGLLVLQKDIERIKSAAPDELDRIAEKWHAGKTGRFALLQTLAGAHAQAAEDYQAAVILDRAGRGDFESGFAPDPSYQAMSAQDKTKLKDGYRNLSACFSDAVKIRRDALAALYVQGSRPADWMSLGVHRPAPAQTDAESMLASSDPAYFALCQSLGRLLPHLGSSVKPFFSTGGKNPGQIFYDALKVRNLEMVRGFDQTLGKSMDVSSRTRDLAKTAGETMSAGGEQVHYDFPHLMARFEEELGSHYAAVGRKMETDIMLGKLAHARSRSELAEGLEKLGQMYGKEALIVTATGLAFSKAPGSRMLSKFLINALTVWDVYDGDYVGAGTLMVGMYGGSRVPLLGRALPFGRELQVLAIGKMAKEGVKAAGEGVENLQYGVTIPGTVDAATSLMVGLLVPVYHGQIELKQVRDIYQKAASAAGNVDWAAFAPGGAHVRGSEVKTEWFGRDNWVAMDWMQSIGKYRLTLLSTDPSQVQVLDATGKNVDFQATRPTFGGSISTMQLKEGYSVRIEGNEYLVKDGRLGPAGGAQTKTNETKTGTKAGETKTENRTETKTTFGAGQKTKTEGQKDQGGQSKQRTQTNAPGPKIAARTVTYDAYSELGLPKMASVKQMKAARKKWVQKNPGAVNGADKVAEERYKRINAEILFREYPPRRK